MRQVFLLKQDFIKNLKFLTRTALKKYLFTIRLNISIIVKIYQFEGTFFVFENLTIF